MPERYFRNTHRRSNYSFDRIDVLQLTEQMKQFVSASIPLLQDALGGVHGPMNMYDGKVGIAMALNRAQRHLSQSIVPYPDLNVVGGEIHHRGHSIGLTSDILCHQLYECLRLHRPLDLDTAVYKERPIYEELLNGRCGLALLVDYFQHKGMPLVNRHIVNDVLATVNIEAYPWQWKDKVYYGAAHGTAGILLTLHRLGNQSHFDLFGQLVANARIPSSGNFKSSQGSKRDELVQWCHGATGFIPLLVEYQNSLPTSIEKASNLTHIQEGLRVVWERGLLRKGCGVCHGIAGNGYAFLSAYVFTLNVQNLSEAVAFAEEILKQGPNECCASADHPYSLFEGLAGVLHYLMDLDDILQLHRTNQTEAIHQYLLFDGLRVF